MLGLQTLLERTLKDLPKASLGNVLDQKLRKKNIILSRKQLTEVASKILNGESEVHLPDDRYSNNVDITITKDDVDLAIEIFERHNTNLLSSLNNLTTKIAKIILKTLTKNWKQQRHYEDTTRSNFNTRLLCRWGKPIQQLRMMVTISREFAMEFSKHFTEPSEPHKAEVILRLHARSCQVAEEIITLLSEGFADGAMARWRTLHEIAATELFISGADNDLAEKYILHQGIEAHRAAIEYQACAPSLNSQLFTQDEIDNFKSRYDDLKNRFGNDYCHPYGWASAHLQMPKPTFRDIEKASGISHFRSYYRLASHNVHANPKGIFYKLGLIDDRDILLTGPSNGGLADPGCCTAISLAQTACPLMKLHTSFDTLVIMKILQELSEDTEEKFILVHQKLLAESYDETVRDSQQ